MLHIFSYCQRRIKTVFAVIIAFACLLGLSGCGNQTNDSLETYHNEDYGFSISVDKELMEYIQIQEKATDGTQEVVLDFIYYDEGTHYGSNGEEYAYINWGVFFEIYVEPVGTKPQVERFQLMGSNEQYSFYFGNQYIPYKDLTVQAIYEQYEEKVNQIPSTFSIDK